MAVAVVVLVLLNVGVVMLIALLRGEAVFLWPGALRLVAADLEVSVEVNHLLATTLL